MPAEKRSEEGQSASWPPTKKKKRSRWTNDEMEKTFIPGMPTTLPADASDDQKEQYLLQLQIEDISRRLRSGDLGIPANPEERSPSPEPIYNNEGKRLNTREYRTRKTLEENRHIKVTRLLQLNANYKPPPDYKPPVIRVNDKVMIPQDDHPEINFVGLLIGPRGNTLKNLEKDTGAKIIIRGKGSVKEGKIGRKDGQPLPGEDEPLHAYITANDAENVKKAVEKIKQIIQEGIEVPEAQNDLRKQQLRELALLNGTLRDNDGLQKLRQIAEAQTIVTNTIICTACGGAGHIAKDCLQKRPSQSINQALIATESTGDLPANSVLPVADRAKMDSEYMSLMAELGQVAPDTVKADLAQHMPSNNTTTPATRVSRFDRKERMPVTTTSSGPTLSSDYGYGGRRSRFDDLGAPTSGYDSRRSDSGPSLLSTPPPRFASSNYPPASSSFDRFNNNMSSPGGWGAPSGPPPRGPPPNRWGAPPPMPPPGHGFTPPGAPPPMGGYNPVPPPPPPNTSPWQQNSMSGPPPMASSAPWQQTPAPPTSNPLPPWQQPTLPAPPSGYNPVAPPPPPPNFGGAGFTGFSAPPPPPPQ